MQITFGQTNTVEKKIQCDDSLWNRIYHSYRLEVIEKCKRVTGVVIDAKFEADGDATMNYEKQNGLLVVEVVCATLIDGKNAEKECNNYVNNVYLPRIGEHIEIIGSFVLDTKHSWNEIHPVTSIVSLKN